MAAPTDTFCDPGLGSDTGTGTVGDPYGRASGSVVQWVLDNITRDSTNGDVIHIKSGTDDVLSSNLSLAIYGTPGTSARLGFRGYASSKDDGGIGGISGNGSYGIFNSTSLDNIDFIDLHLHNSGSQSVVTLDNSCSFIRCEIDGSTYRGLDIDNECRVLDCEFHDISVHGLFCVNYNVISGCYFRQGDDTYDTALYVNGNYNVAINNIISVDSTSDGIKLNGWQNALLHSSVISSAGTGSGILSISRELSCDGNLVEGFSGVGGIGFELTGTLIPHVVRMNGAYNNTTNYSLGDIMFVEDNESLGSSLFAKSGSDTFANRFTYFAPNDVGNVIGGLPNGRDKGAVQSAAAGGGVFVRRIIATS